MVTFKHSLLCVFLLFGRPSEKISNLLIGPQGHFFSARPGPTMNTIYAIYFAILLIRLVMKTPACVLCSRHHFSTSEFTFYFHSSYCYFFHHLPILLSSLPPPLGISPLCLNSVHHKESCCMVEQSFSTKRFFLTFCYHL